MSFPVLRFKEFSASWKTVTFGEIFSFKTTNSYSRDCLNYESGTVKNIHYGDIHTKFKSRFNINNELVPFINKNINLAKINSDCFCMEGDLVIADASEDYKDIGKCIEIDNLDNQAVIAGLHTFLARPRSGVFSRGFISQAMQSNAVRLQIMTIAQGTKVLSISTGRLSKVKIPLPDRAEQTKISRFLAAVDGKITQLTQKHDLLTQYKKGVMQQIFCNELRFKDDDGRDFPEWEEKNLGDFLIPDFREVSKPKGEYLSIGVRSHCKGTFQKPDADPAKNSMDKLFVVHQGDLIVNITFAWEGAIAIVKKEDHGGYVSHRFPTYTFRPEITSSDFFQYVFVHPKFRETLEMISPGGAGRNRVLSKKDFLKITCNLPTLKEQTKIANFLNAIDDKVTATKAQLDAVKQYKQGLLQQMFV